MTAFPTNGQGSWGTQLLNYLTEQYALKKSNLTTTAVKTTTYTAAAWELVRADISGGSFTVTLPSAATAWEVVVKITAASATVGSTTCTVAAAGTDTINIGLASVPLRYSNQAKTFVSNGSGVITVSGGDFDKTVNDSLYLPPTYTLAARPTATGSKSVIFVSDVSGGQLQQDTAAATWTPLAAGVGAGAFGLITSTSATANSPLTPTSSTTDVDSGISVTFTAVASAQYAIRLVTQYANTVITKVVNVSICDSSNTRLAWSAPVVPVANTGYPCYQEALVTPGAGSVTYKARVSTGSAGTATLIGTTTGPTIMSVYRVA